MSIVDLVALIANIALTLTFVVGLIFGIVQVKAAERDRRERLTLEMLQNFQTREFAELMQFVINNELPKSRQEMNALPAEDQVKLIQYSQQMESLGMLVAENFIDLDLVDKILGLFVAQTWKKYKVFFSQIRADDPYTGEYFQWLATRIAERAKNSPRDPFYVSGPVRRRKA